MTFLEIIAILIEGMIMRRTQSQVLVTIFIETQTKKIVCCGNKKLRLLSTTMRIHSLLQANNVNDVTLNRVRSI